MLASDKLEFSDMSPGKIIRAFQKYILSTLLIVTGVVVVASSWLLWWFRNYCPPASSQSGRPGQDQRPLFDRSHYG